MKRFFPIITSFLLFFFIPLFSKTAQDPGIALRLNKRDQLLYEIIIEKSQKLSDFNRVPLLKNSLEKTRLRIIVEDIPEPGSYLLSYKKLFTKKYTKTGEMISSSDSRFPEYGQDLHAVISCYLNSVSYSVLFSIKEQILSITNLKQISSGLINYVESRGIKLDQYARLECEYFTREEIILKDLGILNFYPGNQDEREWAITQADENKELFHLLVASDTSYIIRSEIPDFKSLPASDGVSQKGIRLPRELTVNAETGILLSAESIPNQPPKQIKQMNYHYKLELLSYSKWDKQTIICGQFKGSGPVQICLEYYSGIVGNDVNHIVGETNADGFFSIPLEIEHPVRYRLYLLKNFPIRKNKHVDLYVEPGDSIYVFTEELDEVVPQLSGRGYQNSEFLNRRSLGPFISLLFRAYNPMLVPSYMYLESFDRLGESMIKTEQSLEAEKNRLTKGFYMYMNTGIENLRDILEISESWSKHAEDYRSGNPNKTSIPGISMPQLPYYDQLSNLVLYANYIRLYAEFRYLHFNSFNVRKYGYYNLANQLAFSRILLDGYPLYTDLVNQLEQLARRPDKEHYNYRHHFNEFLESSNSQKANEYVRRLYKQLELLQPGKEMSRMDLVDLNGEKWDWEKTKGKIIVCMLFKDYNSAHYLCENLYKEYGYNKKDVIVLRISPGISFQHWKKINTTYSHEMHQMYFTDGEDAINDRFIIAAMNNWKFLIIDRNGKIFRHAELQNIKIAIKEALAQPLPPAKPFIETTFARILFGALLGMLISIVLYRIIVYRRLKRRSLMQKMSELEQKAMKAQLNPHFLFNSLNSIQHLIRSNQLKDADSYLSVFASLIRKILDNSDKESVTISEEMDTIGLYLELEQMRFDFHFEIQIDPEIDEFNTMIPTMMLQPVVENAILHGLAPQEGDRKLILGVSLQDDIIIFKVEDNGIGRAASSKLLHGHDSKGLNIIQSRIDILNRTDPNKYKLEIIDLEDQDHNSSGTLVEISIPDEK